MCQSLAEGGRRCPTHQPATLGTKAYCKEIFGLPSGQINHTFKKLRIQGNNHPAPTLEEYQAFINKMKEVTQKNVAQAGTKRRISTQLNKTLEEHQLPDGATFYALKKMIPRSRDQKRELVQLMREYATENNVTKTQARQTFDHYYNNVDEESFSNSWSDDFDAGTRYAYNQMKNQATETPRIASTPRIALEFTSAGQYQYGYDPDDGRLELNLPSGSYAFHNVPPEMAERVAAEPLEVLRELRANGLYHYDDEAQAQDDGYGRWCFECHQYKAKSGHICEPTDAALSIEEEDDHPQVSSTGLTLDSAQARIRQALEDFDNQHNSQEIPRRAQARMTARRTLWASPLEDRESLSLTENTERADGAGHQQYTSPPTTTIREEARQGKIVKVTLERRSNSPSYGRDYGVDPYVTMAHDLEFYCDDATGDVKMRMVNTPRCNCLEYERNGHCRHTRSSSNPNQMNNYLKKDIQQLHQRVDPLAHMRREALNGTLYLPRSNRGSMVTIDGEQHRLEQRWNRNDLANARRLLDSGGKIQFLKQNEGLYIDHYMCTGELSFEANENDVGISIVNTLKCPTCGDQEPCEHGLLLQKHLEDTLLPSNAVVMNSSSRLEVLNRVEENDWQSNPAQVQDVLSTFSTGADQSYIANLDQYIADYRAARQEIANGNNPLPYATENVTNGVCAPGQKAFGIEIEFDIARGRSAYDVIDNVGRGLYNLGLTETPEMQRWHHAARTSNPYSAWSLERDSTVAAEIVSPILHDTPETWENIQKIYDLLNEYGAEGSARCGLHVHMGTVNREQSRRSNRATMARKAANILHFYSANEDAIRRVQTDPFRKTHRNSSYAPALDRNSIQNSLYYFNAGHNQLDIDHRTSVNFGYSDRIEFRGADGTMSASHTQAQVMMTSAIVAAAERGDLPAGDNYENLKHQRVGTNARRLQAVKALTPDAEELTDDQLIVSDASYRNFITSLFNTDHGRKMMVGIAAMTPWQR